MVLISFDNEDFFDDNGGWDMASNHLSTNMTAGMSDFWDDIIENEAMNFDIVAPEGINLEEGDLDWEIPYDCEHRDKLVHHDCVWAGSCEDSVHPLPNTFIPSEPVTTTPGQSLLRRNPSPTPELKTERPDTPDGSSVDGDEPPEFVHAVDVAGAALRLLRDSAAVAADHSYTLAKPIAVVKPNPALLGVQTPSDSEEEIDVVSVGAEKNSKQLLIDRNLNQPCVQPKQVRRQAQRSAPTPTATPRPAARKRLSPPAASAPQTKRARGPGRRRRRSTDSESDNGPDVERRSLHNDMERMRRVGLKNLFDELKYAVPATRDKERAAKVVILREATALCTRLTEEDREREELQRQQEKLRAKLKKLRMAAARAGFY